MNKELIKYQDNLINRINLFSKLPHSILLIGDYGSGHENVCEYIADKFNLNIIDITTNISYDYINEIYSNLTKTLYCINIDEIDIYRQSMLLKLFEEPSDYAYIILNCSNEELVLDTLKNRSYILKFSNFNAIQLEEYISNIKDKDIILEICTTPGQIELANYTDMAELKLLCDKMISLIGTANFQNVLSIADKVNFSDEYDKFNIVLFFKMLKYSILHCNYIERKLEIYDLVLNHSKYILSVNNKKTYFENMLINLYDIMKKY